MPLPEVDDSLRWRRALLAANLEARAYDHFEPAWPAHAPEGRSLSSCGPDPLDDYLLDEWFPYRDRAEVEREAWEASVEPVLVAWRKVAASEGSWLAIADEWARRGESAVAIAALREGLLHHPDSETLTRLLRNLGPSDPDAAAQLPEAVHEEEPEDTPWMLVERIRQLARAGSGGADSEVALAPLLDQLIERQEVGDALEARTAAASWLSPESCEIALRLLPPDEATMPQSGETPVWGEHQVCVLEQCGESRRAAALRLQLLPFWETERFAGVLWWPKSELKGLEWEDIKRELASRIAAEPEATVWRHFCDLSLRRLGDEAARLSNLRAWLAADPDDARALSALASLLVGADELTEARRLLERLVGRGDSEVLRFRIATIDALAGDWERVGQLAKTLFDGGASTPRRRAEVSYLMGRAALETGAVSEGLRHLRDWVELAQTRDAFPISLVALAHAKAGGVEWSAWQALDKRIRAPIDELPRWSSANPHRAAAMTVARALYAAGHEAAALELAAWAKPFPGIPPSLDLTADCLASGESCRVDLSPPVAGWPELDALVLHRWRGEGSRAERPSR